MYNYKVISAKLFALLRPLFVLCLTAYAAGAQSQTWTDVTTGDGSTVTPRHEAGYLAHNNKLYLFGGRGNRPVSVYDSSTNLWATLPASPIELHHFQPVALNDKIYILGSFTCCYPLETIVEDIYTFDPATGIWEVVGTMPVERARGSTAAIVRNNKIYLLGGNTQGHSGGAVTWFDEYDPATNQWRQLPDAPTQRDHFSAALVGNKLVATAGRQTNGGFANLVSTTDVYNFSTGQWTTTDPIPTPRAGAVIATHNNNIYVMGGETDVTSLALKTVEAYNVGSGEWRTFTDMINGRHSGGGGVLNDRLHIASGNLSRGGSYETELHEAVELTDSDGDGLLDTEELFVHFTDPTKADSDNDGINDWQEVRENSNPTVNSTTDSDGDGLTDQLEIYTYGTNPLMSDTDGDSLTDRAEIVEHQTNPLSMDSDSDGLNDDFELSNLLDPMNADTDGDTLTDGSELNTHNTDPALADTDEDGLGDSDEIAIGSDPLLTDSDQDGLSDGEEVNNHSTNPLLADSDGDTLTDIDELQTHLTSPIEADSDADGIDDGIELKIYSSDPNNPDTDGDGTNDGAEVSAGTSVTNLDEDQDGILNSAEGAADPDGDGIPNFMDLDSDNDGISDTLENTPLTKSTGKTPEASANSPATATLMDSDLDGTPDFLDLDSDQDGITDLEEIGLRDVNVTGRIDASYFVDENNDGWLDTVATSHQRLQDTDGDRIPDYLDHDSDDDGKSDLIETGGIDLDADGVIDEAIDSNADGLHDALFGEARLESDEDGDHIPDHLDSIFSRSLFGCSMLSTNGPADPLLPTLLLLMFAIRYRKSLRKAHNKI